MWFSANGWRVSAKVVDLGYTYSINLGRGKRKNSDHRRTGENNKKERPITANEQLSFVSINVANKKLCVYLSCSSLAPRWSGCPRGWCRWVETKHNLNPNPGSYGALVRGDLEIACFLSFSC